MSGSQNKRRRVTRSNAETVDLTGPELYQVELLQATAAEELKMDTDEAEESKKIETAEAEATKEKSSFLEFAECPVCLEFPRDSTIFTCSNGHVVCGICKPKVKTCPTCRDSSIEQNAFAERYLQDTLKRTVLSCKYQEHGCDVKDLTPKLKEHESKCIYREVTCPAKTRGACNWKGPLSKMLLHVLRQKCAQV